MDASDSDLSALLPGCRELSEVYLMMQQQVSYRLQKISLFIIKIAEIRGLCESGCKWLNKEAISRREEIEAHAPSDWEGIIAHTTALDLIQNTIRDVLLTRMAWLRNFAAVVDATHPLLEKVYDDISEIAAGELENEAGKLATLYKDFYVEKAEYRKLVPEVTPASSSSASRQTGRVTRSSTGGVDSNPHNHSQYINNTRSSRQKAIPTSAGDAIEVDLSSPERRQSRGGSRGARNIQKMNQRDDVDSSDDESRRKEAEQDPANAGNEMITLVDSGSDSEDDSKPPDSVKPAPAKNVSRNARESVAERNRRLLVEDTRRETAEAAEAAVAAASVAKFNQVDSDIDRDGKLDNVGDTSASVRSARPDESHDNEKETEDVEDIKEILLDKSADRSNDVVELHHLNAKEKNEGDKDGTVSSSSSEGTMEVTVPDAASHVPGHVSTQLSKRPLCAYQPVSSVNISVPLDNSSVPQVSHSAASRRNSQNSLIELGNNSHLGSNRHSDGDNGSVSSSSSSSVAGRGGSPPAKHLRCDSSSYGSSNDTDTSSSYSFKNAISSNSNNNITNHSSSSSSSCGNIPRRSGSALGNYEDREIPGQRVPLPAQKSSFKSPVPTPVPTNNGLGSSGNKIDLTYDS